MKKSILASAICIAGISFSALAQETKLNATNEGEPLAWTIAAYASCEDEQTLYRDVRAEVARMGSESRDVVSALRILQSADNVCGELNEFAGEMLTLYSTDYNAFQSRLLVSEEPPAPTFERQAPKGNSDAQSSFVLKAAADLPPPQGSQQSSPSSSDYSN
ncbi:MAG: hypothetical protein AAGA89_00295 [Pseudomonadota bacterium]